MHHFRRTICLALALCLVSGLFAVPANASEDPLAMKDYESFGAAAPAEPETTEENTVPPAEAEISQEAVVQETLPPEEQPVKETVPEDATIPAMEEEVAAETAEEELTEESKEQETMPAEEEQEEVIEEAPLASAQVPLFFQTDYPDVRFGSGTIANNGCSITSLAMVATYMTGHEYLPDELARYFGGRAENNIARLEMGSDALQLPYKKSENWHETFAALQEGKLVIALMEQTSLFTQSQHFIVLTGMNEEGRILVNDSYEPNYDKWELKRGFAEGFAPGEILQGYSGAWIYDVDAMPENPFIYSEPEPVRGEPRYPEIQLTLAQEDLLAKVIWVEARGECEEGQQAVAEVVLNRMASDKFPNSLHDVIYGEGQFRSAEFLDEAEPHQVQYEAIERAIYGPYILPEDVYYFATFPTTEKVWGEIGGHIFCYAQD